MHSAVNEKSVRQLSGRPRFNSRSSHITDSKKMVLDSTLLNTPWTGVAPSSTTRWLVGFYGISPFVGYLMPNPFLYK